MITKKEQRLRRSRQTRARIALQGANPVYPRKPGQEGGGSGCNQRSATPERAFCVSVESLIHGRLGSLLDVS